MISSLIGFASHEAGHAVALHLHGLPLQSLRLDAIPDAEELAPRWMTQHSQVGHADQEVPVTSWLGCLVAGEVAAAIHEDRHWNYSAPDLRTALALAAGVSEGAVDEAWALLTWLLYRIRRTLGEAQAWRKMEAVARALLDRERLTVEDIEHMVREESGVGHETGRRTRQDDF